MNDNKLTSDTELIQNALNVSAMIRNGNSKDAILKKAAEDLERAAYAHINALSKGSNRNY